MNQRTRCERSYFNGSMNAGFSAFDKNGDGLLCLEEFRCVCKALFRNDDGIVYSLEEDELRDIFDVFDQNKDGFIDTNEFIFCWNKWIKVIVRPVCALLIVDVQNDFICGSLNISNCPAQQNGLDVIEPLNRLIDTVHFEAIFYSLDWHPPNHISFFDNLHLRSLHPSSPVTAENAKVYNTVVFAGPPVIEQKLWPRHCVQNTWGAELHEHLHVVDHAIKVTKGSSSEIDAYSVFWDNMKLQPTLLAAMMKEKSITDLFIGGIAYDVCVNATVDDSLSAGYRTILLDDCCRGLDAENIEKTKTLTTSNHGVIINSGQVKAMVEGRDRRPELGYKLALALKKKM